MNLSDKPLIQSFQLNGVKHIAVSEAYEIMSKDEAFIIDVREDDEVGNSSFYFQNVLHHPMSEIMDRLHNIPKEIPLIIVCEEGVKSTKVANVFNRHGFAVVANLDGGLNEWEANGLPLIPGNNFDMDVDSCSPTSCGGCTGCG